MTKNRKFLIKVFSIIAIVFVGLLGFMMFITKYEKSSLRLKGHMSCFTGGGLKCGNLNASKKEIIEEIKFLELSLEEARQLILKAQSGSQKRIIEFNSKINLTDDEKSIKKGMELSQPYYERVLEAIDEKENE